MSDSRHATQRAPMRMGWGYRPLLTPAHHPLRETGTCAKTVGNRHRVTVCCGEDGTTSAFAVEYVFSTFSGLLAGGVELTGGDDLTMYFLGHSSSLQIA